MEKTRVIVWAVDPFAEDYRKQEAAIHAINSLAAPGMTIQPVYVWNGKGTEAYGDPGQLIGKTLMERMREQADATLRKWAVPRLEIPLEGIRILRSESSSYFDQASAIVDFAKKIKSTLTVACHTPRKPVHKWFAGSFCESLSFVSQASVLIVPESWKSRQPSKEILFATDFSAQSMAIYDRVLDFAEERQWGITVFHSIEYSVYPAVDFVYAATDTFASFEKSLVTEAQSKAESLASRARDRGIAARVVIDKTRGNHAGFGVMRELEKGYGLVAVAAHSGTLHRTFMGSTSRFLIRESGVPVWVLRPTGSAQKRVTPHAFRKPGASKSQSGRGARP